MPQTDNEKYENANGRAKDLFGIELPREYIKEDEKTAKDILQEMLEKIKAINKR